MRMAILGVSAFALSCQQPAARAPLAPAGDMSDEGHGELARASARLFTSAEPEPTLAATREQPDEESPAASGTAYGGVTYGSYTPPAWNYPYISRAPSYTPRADLTGAIAGAITWRGAVATLTTSCGVVPTVRVGPGHGLAGAIVYIERLAIGRATAIPGEQRPATVGGVVVKRGCALLPSAQVVTPVPAQLTINGDKTAVNVRITSATPTVTSELEEGGRIALQAAPGITRIDAADGTLAAAYVVGITTPAYAITDDAGRFRIDELARGTYEVTIWAPPLPTLSNGKLVYGDPMIIKRTIKVEDKRTARLDATLGK